MTCIVTLDDDTNFQIKDYDGKPSDIVTYHSNGIMGNVNSNDHEMAAFMGNKEFLIVPIKKIKSIHFTEE